MQDSIVKCMVKLPHQVRLSMSVVSRFKDLYQGREPVLMANPTLLNPKILLGIRLLNPSQTVVKAQFWGRTHCLVKIKCLMESLDKIRLRLISLTAEQTSSVVT